MSVFTECVGCLEHPLRWEDLLGMVIFKDSDDSWYLNIKFNEKEQCDDYENAVNCASPQTAIEMFARLIVEDDCGNCAINIIANICDACD